MAQKIALKRPMTAVVKKNGIP